MERERERVGEGGGGGEWGREGDTKTDTQKKD